MWHDHGRWCRNGYDPGIPGSKRSFRLRRSSYPATTIEDFVWYRFERTGVDSISRTGSVEFAIMATSHNYPRSNAAYHRGLSLDLSSLRCILQEFSHSSIIMDSAYVDTLMICKFISTVCPGQWGHEQFERTTDKVHREHRDLNVKKQSFVWMSQRQNFSGLARQDDSTATPTQSKSETAPSRSSKTVRCLGVVLDPAMSFKEHVAGLTNACYYHLRQLRSVRRSLSVDSWHALVRALILSRIDYCNGLLGGATNAMLDQINRVLRASARLILQKPRFSQITAEINDHLHWLDARAQNQLETLHHGLQMLE